MLELMVNSWRPILEIIILWFVFYRIMLFFEGTRAAYVSRGIIFLIIAFFVFHYFHLRTLEWILAELFAISVLGVIVIFQPELRYGLAHLGQSHIFSSMLPEEDAKRVVKEIIRAALALSKKRNGALIAIERENKLKTYKETGVAINADVSSDLILSIFTPTTPLHDGGVIIRADKVVSAACLFPLTDNPYLSRTFGTRHRAAIGLTEDSDAVVVVVSESTGDISVAREGVLSRNLNKNNLEKVLLETFSPPVKKNENKVVVNE